MTSEDTVFSYLHHFTLLISEIVVCRFFQKIIISNWIISKKPDHLKLIFAHDVVAGRGRNATIDIGTKLFHASPTQTHEVQNFSFNRAENAFLMKFQKAALNYILIRCCCAWVYIIVCTSIRERKILIKVYFQVFFITEQWFADFKKHCKNFLQSDFSIVVPHTSVALADHDHQWLYVGRALNNYYFINPLLK